MALNIKSFNDPMKDSLHYRFDFLEFCDAIIVAADGSEFKAHKLILSMRSGFFRSYFRDYIQNNQRLALTINKDILENILVFIYTGKTSFNAQNIASIIIAADYLMIDDLLDQCKRFAFQEISTENCISLLKASYIVDGLGITKHCYRFVQIYFGIIVHRNLGIEELPFATLKNLLMDDSLGVANEETVWEAIQIWVNGDKVERLNHVPDLLKCIRWNSDSYNLEQCIYNHSIVRENIFCKSIEFEKSAPTSNFEVSQQFIPKSSQMRCPCKMYLFIRKSLKVCELYLTYDEKCDIWRKIGEINNVLIKSVFAKGRCVYIFHTLGMKAFDLIQNSWVKQKKVRSFQDPYCVVESQNGIFVIGSFNRYASNTANGNVKFYDPTDNSWNFCCPVPASIEVVYAAIINTKLYAIGYQETFNGRDMRALSYDIISDEWSGIEAPRQFRLFFAIINYRDQIYIFGGVTNNREPLTSVEKYNNSKNEWEEFPPLPLSYEHPGAMIIQNKLIVHENTLRIMYTSRLQPCIWNDDTEAWDVVNVASPFYQIHKYVLCCIEDRDVLLELSKGNKTSEILWTKSPFQ